MKFSHIYAIGLMCFASPAFAADKAPDIGAAIGQWKAAVESGSVDSVMALYDTNAVMISTFAQHPMTKRSQIEGYYQKVLSNPDIHVDVSNTHPRRFGNMAIDSGEYTLSYTQDGESVIIPARFSFVYQLEGGKWEIVDHHSSRVPMAEEAK